MSEGARTAHARPDTQGRCTYPVTHPAPCPAPTRPLSPPHPTLLLPPLPACLISHNLKHCPNTLSCYSLPP